MKEFDPQEAPRSVGFISKYAIPKHPRHETIEEARSTYRDSFKRRFGQGAPYLFVAVAAGMSLVPTLATSGGATVIEAEFACADLGHCAGIGLDVLGDLLVREPRLEQTGDLTTV